MLWALKAATAPLRFTNNESISSGSDRRQLDLPAEEVIDASPIIDLSSDVLKKSRCCASRIHPARFPMPTEIQELGV
jgi:hypothetical protein